MGDDQNTVRSTSGSPNGEPFGEEAKLGPILERARLERGLTLEEAEQATKIRKRYLEGLEREEYGVLPDAVYARGFLKTYANFLGLDGEDLSQRLREHRRPRRERTLNYNAPSDSGFERPLITPGGLAGTKGRRFPMTTVLGVVVAVVVLLVVIGALYFVGRGAQISGPEGEPRQARERPDARASGAKEAANAAAAAARPAPAEGVRAVVRVEQRPVWVSVSSDGSVVYEEVAQPGFSEAFDADRELSVTAGDAGAVTAEINGQDVGPLGAGGEVLTRTWTVKSAS